MMRSSHGRNGAPGRGCAAGGRWSTDAPRKRRVYSITDRGRRALSVATSADVVAGLRHGDGGPGTWALVVAAAAATAVVAALALAAVLVATRRTRTLARHADETAGDDVLDDLRLLVLTTGDRLLPAGAPDRARSTAARLADGPVGRAVSLRSHPWRLCMLLALGAGAALAAGHLAGEGPPTDGMLVLLAVGGLIAAIEAAAVIACFALLGTFLGIRRGGR